MDSAPETLYFSTMRKKICDQKFSSKSIEREKRRLIEKHKKNWASLGGEALQLLAVRYAEERKPTKATIAQMACLAHRLVTVLPSLVLSPIAAMLGGLKAQFAASDVKIHNNLKQKFLLHTLRRLNDKIGELYLPKLKKTGETTISTSKPNYLISAKVTEDLKAILTYAKTFDEIHYQTLRKQIARFEKFIELINKRRDRVSVKRKKTAIFIDPTADEEI